MPFAFTEHGVAQLSSVLNSDIAIEINIQIIRAFIIARLLILNPLTDKPLALKQEIKDLKEYIEETFNDYNDINEITSWTRPTRRDCR